MNAYINRLLYDISYQKTHVIKYSIQYSMLSDYNNRAVNPMFTLKFFLKMYRNEGGMKVMKSFWEFSCIKSKIQ